MELLVWTFVIGTIFFAIMGFARSFSPKPDADAQATCARRAKRRRETELAAEQAARQGAAEVEREFP